MSIIRWPTTVTSKQNAHINFKSLTSNSNHSHQIQITHSKLTALTANLNCSQQIKNPPQQITNRSHQIQIVHIKYKSFTSNTNRSRQIEIAHSKYKCGQCKTKTADCGLQTGDQGKSILRVKCRLGVKCRMETAD